MKQTNLHLLSVVTLAMLFHFTLVRSQTTVTNGSDLPDTEPVQVQLYNIGADKYLNAGASWGTEAVMSSHGIYFEMSKSGDGYIFSSDNLYTNTNKYLSINAYGSIYVDLKTAKIWTVDPVEGQNGEYTIKYGDQYLISNDEGIVELSSTTLPSGNRGYWKFVNKADFENNFMSAATDDKPVDASSYLINPDFVPFAVNGFSGTAFTNVGDDKAGYRSSKDGTNIIASQDNKAFDDYQTITVPNGKYRISANGLYGGSTPAYLYANDTKVEFQSLYDGDGNIDYWHYPNKPDAAAAAHCFADGYYLTTTPFVYVSDNTLKVGFTSDDAKVLSARMDNLHIYYYGSETTPSASDISDLEATMPSDKKMNGDVRSAMDAAKTALDATASSENYKALANSIENARRSVLAYNAVAATKDVIDHTNFYTKEAYDKFNINGIWAKYQDETLSDEDARKVGNAKMDSIWHNSQPIGDVLLSAWGVTNDDNQYDKVPYLNTWSHENDEGDFRTPYLEYFNNYKPLAPRTFTGTLTGITPGVYKITLKARVLIADGGGDAAKGVTVDINGKTPYDLTTGTPVNGVFWEQGKKRSSSFITGNFTTYGTVGEDGVLKLNVNVLNGSNISWVSLKDINYEQISQYYIIDENTDNNAADWSETTEAGTTVRTKNAVEDATNARVLLLRTFTPNAWNSLVLPFDLTNEELRAIFGYDTRVAAYVNSEKVGEDHYHLYFDQSQNDIKANTPVMIYGTNEGQTEWWFGDVNMKAPTDMTVSDKGPFMFTGSYNYGYLIPQYSYFFSNNNFKRSSGKSRSKATRGYFTLNDTQEAKAKARIDWDTTTAIDFLPADIQNEDQDLNSYNLNGQRVDKSYRGIVVENGKKIIRK